MRSRPLGSSIAITIVLFGTGGLGARACRADIFYVSTGANIIERYTSAGVGSDFFLGGTGAVGGVGFGSAAGMAYDGAGNLFVAGSDNIARGRIYKITPAGVGSVFATFDINSGVATGLAFDSAGNLYASKENTILKFTPNGVSSVFASAGLSAPGGLAFDSAGNLYAANFGNNTIEKFTPSGVGSVFAAGLARPTGLAFDSAGNLFVANYGISDLGNIERITFDGAASIFYGGGIGIQRPMGLAFGSTGLLYVVSQSNNRIERFTPSGIRSDFVVDGNLSQPSYLALTDDAGVPLRLANLVPGPGAMVVLGLGGLIATRRRSSRE